MNVTRTLVQLLTLAQSTSILGLAQSKLPGLPPCRSVLSPPVIVRAVAEEDFISGRVSPAEWSKTSTLEAFALVPENKQNNVPSHWLPLEVASAAVDSIWGDFRLQIVGGNVPAGPIAVRHTAGGDCGYSAIRQVEDTFTKGMWLNWSGDIPIRDRDTKINGTAGPSVSTIRAVVTAPRADMPAALAVADNGVTTTAPAESRSPADNLLGLVQQVMKNAGKPDRPASETGDTQSRQATALDQQVTIERQARELQCYLGEIEQTIDVPVAEGKFQIVFERNLDVGQCVVIYPIRKSGIEIAGARQTAVVQPSWADWGRVQGTLYTGFALGQTRETSVSSDPYVSFLVDGSVFGDLLGETHLTSSTANAKQQLLHTLSMKNFGISGNFFAEGRLTQAASGFRADLGPLGAEQTQALFWQVGLYLPVRFKGMDWRHKASTYSFFVAPVVKYGAQWLKDGVLVSRTVVREPDDRLQTSGAVVPGKEVATEGRAKEAHVFYSYGTRLGFMRYTLIGDRVRNRQLRHDLVSYLDITFGQNRAFRTAGILETRAPGSAASRTYQGSSVDTRMMLEGRVKLPGLPFFVGMDLNLAKDRPGDSVTDFRFVLGLRLDVAQTLGRLFQPPK